MPLSVPVRSIKCKLNVCQAVKLHQAVYDKCLIIKDLYKHLFDLDDDPRFVKSVRITDVSDVSASLKAYIHKKYCNCICAMKQPGAQSRLSLRGYRVPTWLHVSLLTIAFSTREKDRRVAAATE